MRRLFDSALSRLHVHFQNGADGVVAFVDDELERAAASVQAVLREVPWNDDRAVGFCARERGFGFGRGFKAPEAEARYGIEDHDELTRERAAVLVDETHRELRHEAGAEGVRHEEQPHDGQECADHPLLRVPAGVATFDAGCVDEALKPVLHGVPLSARR